MKQQHQLPPGLLRSLALLIAVVALQLLSGADGSGSGDGNGDVNGSLRASSSFPNAKKNKNKTSIFTTTTTTSVTTNSSLPHGTAAHLIQQRHLLENQMHFAPLACNQNLDQAACVVWNDKFGGSDSQMVVFDERVIIPCGECVLLQQGNLEFRDGIDIQGKLVIEPLEVYPSLLDTATTPIVTLRSTMIAVQGELHVDASMLPVNGVPAVEFVLYNNNGHADEYFAAINENTPMCTLNGNLCVAGKKSIVVAGGKVNLHGLPPNTPSWLPLYDVVVDGIASSVTNTTNKLVLNASIQNKWSPGASLLITSHTPNYEDQQVAQIANIAVFPTDTTKVIVELDTFIARPTTQQDDDGGQFAVEVALLSKNIRWRGLSNIPGNQVQDEQGGHFWIMHTPKVIQVIEGVELLNFGQQGNLGRYPLHFHFCGDVEGSRISKNTIRQSNQRCLVVHGTNNLLIEENIAFDTKGHCFMLEDGIEVGNHFHRNLGALTSPPRKVIPDDGTNGSETDRICPSTFWFTNRMNKFTGNVAAGSSASGFWFELLTRGPLKSTWMLDHPKKLPLTSFKDNVAHSCETGFRTYPTGYNPSYEALFENLRMYRNRLGIFFHLSKNYCLEGGIFADNQVSLDIDRADDMIIHGTEFIAASDSYRSQAMSQGLTTHCGIGTELHNWKFDRSGNNTFLDSIVYRGFGAEFCEDSIPIRFEGRSETGVFDYFLSMKNITFEDISNGYFDLCGPKNANVLDAYVVDLDGSLKPATMVTARSFVSNEISVLVSDESSALSFLGAAQCNHVPQQCYMYCEGVCFQSAIFSVDPFGKESSLKICAKSSPTDCISISGRRQSYPRNELYRHNHYRRYAAHLPAGEYTAVFLDKHGSETWPSFVHASYEPHMCKNGLAREYIEVKQPAITIEECSELIRNGMIQADFPNAYNGTIWPWVKLFQHGTVNLAKGEGISGSDALKANLRLDYAARVGQFIDSRCIPVVGDRTFRINAWIKLVDAEGTPILCDPDTQECPTVGFLNRPVGTVSMVTNSDGYQLATAQFTFNGRMVRSDNTYLFQIRSYRNDLYMYVDNVSMTLIDSKDTGAAINDALIDVADMEEEEDFTDDEYDGA